MFLRGDFKSDKDTLIIVKSSVQITNMTITLSRENLSRRLQSRRAVGRLIDVDEFGESFHDET
jgi:hypothetical protein